MKFLPSQLAYLLQQRESRQNLKALAQYMGLLSATIGAFTVLFHVIMVNVEGQNHSWLTGLYWTLTVMTTLGFGDITFQSDLGRFFSLLVLVTGLLMLLIMLPFTFIRFFYAPWLEAQIRVRAPLELPPETEGHVIICRRDEVAAALVPRLEAHGIPHVTLEPDKARAAELMLEGVPVLAANMEDPNSYLAARVQRATLVLANGNDATNCNITLTAREVAPDVPIAALVEHDDSEDVIEMAGANHVLLIKRKLGEHLAGRAAAGRAHAQVVGRFGELLLAELPVHGTALSGQMVRDTDIRERTGLNIVGCWKRGHLGPAQAHTVLEEHMVVVVAGSADQVAALDALLEGAQQYGNRVLVIGGGRVGRSAARALHLRGIDVTVIEKDPALAHSLGQVADEVICGDASDYSVITRAGIESAPSVVLTANDDALNILLALYCRKLNPEIRIVSRITLERNLEAIHRAGADFVLSFTTLAASSIMAILQGRETVILGEDVDVFTVRTPRSLAGLSLSESGIGASTGLNVIALSSSGNVQTALSAATRLEVGVDLVMIGTPEQRDEFRRRFKG